MSGKVGAVYRVCTGRELHRFSDVDQYPTRGAFKNNKRGAKRCKGNELNSPVEKSVHRRYPWNAYVQGPEAKRTKTALVPRWSDSVGRVRKQVRSAVPRSVRSVNIEKVVVFFSVYPFALPRYAKRISIHVASTISEKKIVLDGQVFEF